MSESLEDQFYIRQRDIIDKAQLKPITVIGCGASGSGLGIQLAKLGVPMMELYDGDSVEEHNLPNQYYPNSSLGKNKAVALKEVIEQYTPMELLPIVHAHDKFFENGEEILSEIVFMAVDGFDNRRLVFDELVKHPIVKWIIDTRMGAEYFEVITIKTSEVSEKGRYRRTLEGEPLPLPCTGRSVIYNAMCMGGFALSLFVKMIRDAGERIPFKIGYDLRNHTPPLIEWRDDAQIIRIPRRGDE